MAPLLFSRSDRMLRIGIINDTPLNLLSRLKLQRLLLNRWKTINPLFVSVLLMARLQNFLGLVAQVFKGDAYLCPLSVRTSGAAPGSSYHAHSQPRFESRVH